MGRRLLQCLCDQRQQGLQLDKVQVIDAMWDNKEKRREEPFLSLSLMHGEEAHLLLALEDDERTSLLAFARAVSAARNPEK